MDPRLSQAVDRLYSGSPEDFVARRARLAAELSDQGLKAEAAELEKRRRPSVAAAAVNDVVRSHPDEMHALAAVGDRMRGAQDDALAGRGATDLRAANRARKVLVDQLTDAALAVLAVTSPQPEAYRSAVAATFEAATIDPSARAEVESGALVKELSSPSGLGLPVAVVAAPKPVRARASKAVASGDGEAARAEKALAKAAIADARRVQREAQRAADRDDAAAMRARATADEAARGVADLEEQLSDARRADREARTAARVADQAARASAATAAKATDRLDALERAHERS